MQYSTTSEEETKKLGGEIIEKKIKSEEGPVILALTGELGAGKTTFAKGVAAKLGIEKHITSPTFLIMKKYPLDDIEGFDFLYHIDNYRIDSVEDIGDLGLEEIFKNKDNIVVVEWAERIENLIPNSATKISFSHGKEKNTRKITIEENEK